MKKDKFLFLLKEIINDIFRKYRYKLFLLLVLSTIVGLTEGLSMILLLPLLITMGIKSEVKIHIYLLKQIKLLNILI